ncbi:MAG: CDP-alcohol phosphatidyltransferase family protein [Deltaproteobacteria bacterium]|nr:CDP-alcohol phosphatidyltransferase family protein [Deltaproteobacteria bacterium]
MLDKWGIKVTRLPLKVLARPFEMAGITANQVSVAGFFIGVLSVPLLALQQYKAALILIILNRILDGVDGTLARKAGITDRGGFLDITLDFIFYSAVPLGFALADPAHNALPAAVLIFSFVGTASSFLAFAVMAAKRGLDSPNDGRKSLYYLSGITEGTETILFFTAVCILPDRFAVLAFTFALLCGTTAVGRTVAGYKTLD